MTRCVVISAVNFTEGGPLTVLRECLHAAASELSADWKIIALVHDKRLIDEPRVQFVEVPEAKRSWLGRLRQEWISFHALSRQWKPDVWLSLHDITPRVVARRQAVYCHNPAPFYKLPWREARMEPTLFVFNRLYKFIYGTFISRNTWVIVQQNWLRQAFQQLFGNIPVVVAYPAGGKSNSLEDRDFSRTGTKHIFIYPTLPRVFKNIETVMEAARRLALKTGVPFELQVTIAGNENKYAQWLHARYADVSVIKFIGRQSREQMAWRYQQADTVVFPSKLETWGLPISEAKSWEKPLLVAEVPYAHESVGNYDKAQFVPVQDVDAWVGAMAARVADRWVPDKFVYSEPDQPFVSDWPALWNFLIRGL